MGSLAQGHAASQVVTTFCLFCSLIRGKFYRMASLHALACGRGAGSWDESVLSVTDEHTSAKVLLAAQGCQRNFAFSSQSEGNFAYYHILM